jgi:glycolate oxidase FAD binding subunit
MQATEAAKFIASQKHITLQGNGTRTLTTNGEVLSSREMRGILIYEPAEMIIRAKSGTPVAEVEAALREKGQRLAFEPFDHRVIFGTKGEPSVGGMVAMNASGSRRIQAGACRDALIGVQFINGKGEMIKSGGRVMKDVTGYDLVKLMAGSRGTLGFLTEVTFKVQPIPPATVTLSVETGDVAQGIQALSAALGSPFDVTGASFRQGKAYIRLEGTGFSVAYRVKEIRPLLEKWGEVQEVSGDIWPELQTASRFKDAPTLYRVSTPPDQAASLRLEGDYDWGGGLIFTSTKPTLKQGFFQALKGGESQPLSALEAMMSEKIRAVFDPENKFSA